MKTKQIYEEYMIPKNLQEHMLRVAALAEVLLENWTKGNIDKSEIIKACLFHDIAKPITFDPVKQLQYGMSYKDIERLKQLQERLKTKYGIVEHDVSVAICKEIGLSEAAVNIVSLSEWANIPRLLEENNLNSLVEIYCDMRIGPKGILSLKARLLDLERRVPSKNHEIYFSNGNLLEEKIKNNVQIDVNSITDQQINSSFQDLLDFIF
ncbi:hypothetical protein A2767_05310 [Candidatus Roizmanbacteria bacterium RIFCSPHIGHO2_01_FULL_35_10]|uniref:HD domain-containing protein n=1 Tax=Candidatus Roizmanbacteria bacterium RIFCSPLOWO2_01_FULL_35_13 TaxID=1802055 RepID=A0A1F7IBY2_9BACT|nr:MAG: hypothetical protein A2767_05310 [Candidatus Roizmanbacteria bacterium RIFCSPHIGHO2_01_FULL_35_10]OGK40868.1 MAG: hypothetical protein A3A74_05995 [Candidatus Roizmanbacteria bacterium RIFCSPLOWO2_01_FULL_35_13]